MAYWSDTRHEIEEMVQQAYSMHDKVCSELTLEIFWKGLQSYRVIDIREAFIEHAKVSAHCPKLADILKILKEKKTKIATAANIALRAKIDAEPSVYENAYTMALKAGDWREMQRLGTLMAAEYINRLNGRAAVAL